MQFDVTFPDGSKATLPHVGLGNDSPLTLVTYKRTVLRKEGWGDKLENQLTAIGVTKDWYKGVKEKFGLPPTCNCDRRKEWLNRVGAWWRGQ